MGLATCVGRRGTRLAVTLNPENGKLDRMKKERQPGRRPAPYIRWEGMPAKWKAPGQRQPKPKPEPKQLELPAVPRG